MYNNKQHRIEIPSWGRDDMFAVVEQSWRKIEKAFEQQRETDFFLK